ncbi:murein biosynthesis integral membrane protein MurJ [Clostridium sp. SHJSY1]|uniref:murein biosynthesis integral membrane protein MurJ n=1 Tax=Clostridium sp. SHJSY1 TaxID=2942483 RepID=UPI002875951F|nr:murein biosynthesis integral membrane protein MurJ [Clostridium sp. SHJSY1]MDS0527285.1 murein biosynthesis integral membrane protein MurJ [Clostridium sp. SHJSY1]
MKKSNLIKSTAIVMVVALISRCMGFIRDFLIGKRFPAGIQSDAYYAAASIPDIIFALVGLAISTSFLPMLSNIKVKKGNEEMHKFANNIINILFFISLVIFVFSSFFPEQITGLFINKDKVNPQTMEIAIILTRITLINLLFLGVNACFTAILQVHEDFVIPSILGLFFNLPMIAYLMIFKDFNIYGLTVANVIGNFARVVVQIPSLRKHGYKYKPFIDLKDERIKKILILILPVIVGSGANSLNMIVDKNIASGLQDGAITILNNALLLITFINAIITSSINTVVYPVLANRQSEGKNKEFLEVLTRSFVYLGLLLIPITAGIIIYGYDVVGIVFPKYEEESRMLVTLALFGYSFGIFFTGVRDILNSTLFSMGKTKLTAINGVIGMIINIVLSITLSKSLGVLGISIAASVAMMVTAVLLGKSIIKLQGKLDIKLLLKKLAKVIVSTLGMVGIILLINKFTVGLPVFIYVGTGTLVGALVYLCLTYIFKVQEVQEILTVLRNKVKI